MPHLIKEVGSYPGGNCSSYGGESLRGDSSGYAHGFDSVWIFDFGAGVRRGSGFVDVFGARYLGRHRPS